MSDHSYEVKIERPSSVTELVLERLREDIIQDQFAMGAKISEAQLSEYYGVTKAPVRAATLRLAGEGLLEVRPQSGTYVFNPTKKEVRALCELRVALETEALRLAFERDAEALARRFAVLTAKMETTIEEDDRIGYQYLDMQFHDALFEIADSPMLFDTYQSKVVSRISALRFRFSRLSAHHPESINQHKQLQEAIASGDHELAQEILRKHVSYSESYYSTVIQDTGE